MSRSPSSRKSVPTGMPIESESQSIRYSSGTMAPICLLPAFGPYICATLYANDFSPLAYPWKDACSMSSDVSVLIPTFFVSFPIDSIWRRSRRSFDTRASASNSIAVMRSLSIT